MLNSPRLEDLDNVFLMTLSQAWSERVFTNCTHTHARDINSAAPSLSHKFYVFVYRSLHCYTSTNMKIMFNKDNFQPGRKHWGVNKFKLGHLDRDCIIFPKIYVQSITKVTKQKKEKKRKTVYVTTNNLGKMILQICSWGKYFFRTNDSNSPSCHRWKKINNKL